jgi:hypothetical protein
MKRLWLLGLFSLLALAGSHRLEQLPAPTTRPPKTSRRRVRRLAP